jgi:hypothetical protein
VALDAALPAIPRATATLHALARGLTARAILTLLVGASFLARVVAAGSHSVPRYFPDEYLYTALARSIGDGHAPAVRGEAAHFPALLEPLLAAPFQALFFPETAYRLTQFENAFFMSLAAVPVYLLARRLSLSAGYALGCAAFTVAIPDLVYASYTLADPTAFPLALAAVCAGVAAIERPSTRAQALFLALALLATLARVQYIVLPVAFLCSAVVVDRRRVLRSQRLTLALSALPVSAALVLGPSHVLGYYSRVAHLHVGRQLAHWAATDAYLLVLAAGVVLVPGALVALARPRGRTETAFAFLALGLAAGLLFEAALYASNGSARFQERYLFVLLPLVPVAFGLYAKHRRAGRVPVALVSLAIFGATTRIPLSGYSAAGGKADSPLLFAVSRLEHLVGTGNASLVVALLAALAAACAVAVSYKGGAGIALGAAIALAAVVSVGATIDDAASARKVRHAYVPAAKSWVDATGARDVTLVQTAGSPPAGALEQLYWNRGITRELLLGDAAATDSYAAPALRIARDGSLHDAAGHGVTGNLLMQNYAATASFQGARRTAAAGTFTLWSAGGTPRLDLLEEGRYSDGWLAPSGQLRIWPDASGRTRGTLRFSLTLPPGSQPVTVRFGTARYEVLPGRVIDLVYTIDARGPWSLAFSTTGGRWLADQRAVGVVSSSPRFSRRHVGAAAASPSY